MKKRTRPWRDNWLLRLDVYKMGHMEQYKPGTSEVYNYATIRSDRFYSAGVFFGLQPLLSDLTPVTTEMIEEFMLERESILGPLRSADIRSKLEKLRDLGYIPLRVKAVKEGSIIKKQNVLFTTVSTHSEFYWLPGFIESYLLHSWAPCTVASAKKKYMDLVREYSRLTCDNNDHVPFAVHDFGYRAVSSNESAAVLGAATLIDGLGSDNVAASAYLRYEYGGDHINKGPISLSVPATEHSVMCSYGKEDEIVAFERMLELYPEGFVSIVSDTYDVYKVCRNFAFKLKNRILTRGLWQHKDGRTFKPVVEVNDKHEETRVYFICNQDSNEYSHHWVVNNQDITHTPGKVVFRPDSGDPIRVVCGYEDHEVTPQQGADRSLIGYSVNETGKIITVDEKKGCMQILAEVFGTSLNDKGYKLLNPSVGLIYGDGMYYARFEKMLETLKNHQWASSNLVIGIGGLMLQQHNRDELGMAIKATRVINNGYHVEIQKDPYTDPGKKSLKGLMSLHVDVNGEYFTVDQVSDEEEKLGILEVVYENGQLKRFQDIYEVRKIYEHHLRIEAKLKNLVNI